MITRRYFMSGKKIHSDGAGGYSFACCASSHRSWFTDTTAAFDACLSELNDKLENDQGNKVMVESFNRI